MNIHLTDDERDVALKYAMRLEKTADRWRFWRWSGVVAFVAGMCLLLAVDHLGRKMSSLIRLPHRALSREVTPTPELNASGIELLESYIEVRVMSLRAEIFLVIKSLMVAGIGVGMFVYAVSDWRRDRRDRLIAKLLRCLASERDENSAQEGS